MKRLVPAAVIFALVIVICVLSDIAVCEKVKDAKEEIDRCEELYRNSQFAEAEKSAEEFKEHWINISKTVSAYSNHCKLDDISVLSAILPEAVRTKNDFEFNSAVSQIKTALDFVYREQHFTVDNLY